MKRLKNFRKSQIILFMLYFTPSCWITLTVLDNFFPIFDPLSDHQLNKTAALIELYEKQFDEIPTELNQLRLFAFSLGESYAPYDRYGNRLEYHPLEAKSFLLRSYGQDELEDNLDYKDDSLRLLGLKDKNKAVTGEISKESIPYIYQASFLEGIKNPKSELIAQLLFDAVTNDRHLLVTSRNEPNFAMVPAHNEINEFFWLPSGFEMIFTAEKSERYDAGLYLWDLRTGLQTNLWPDFLSSMYPTLPKNTAFYLSLSHVSFDPDLVYFLAEPANQIELNPINFFNVQNLYALSFIKHPFASPYFFRVEGKLHYNAFDYDVGPHSLLGDTSSGKAIQQSWGELSLKGDASELLEKWQEHASKYSQSPMAPYQLWWLASLYSDAFHHIARQAPDQALVVRNFGVEISEALSQMQQAPSYLKAMGRYLKKSLLLSSAPAYNAADLSDSP